MHGPMMLEVLLLSVAVALTSASSAPIVDVGYAKFIGSSDLVSGTRSFRGLPYAAPPLGNLRWRAPVPVEQHHSHAKQHIINATSPGRQCVQGVTPWLVEAGAPYGGPVPDPSLASEDCLFLDVITPLKPTSGALPVIVQIHGGGYIAGNSSSEDGTKLVSYSNGSVVYVQIQYRLGAYGFLGGSAVERDGVLNAGLLDQRLALLWVQKHIAAFGGDPCKVTIWGGSAGGGSVMYQLTWKGGEVHPPFRAAISEYPAIAPLHDRRTQNAQLQTLLRAANCTSLNCLRNLSYAQLASAAQQSYFDGYATRLYGYGDFCYEPVVDGKIVQTLPSEAFAQGKFSRVPIITDHNAFEGVGFTNTSVATTAEIGQDVQRLWPAATKSFISDLLRLYPASDYQAAFFNSNNFFASFVYPAVAQLAGLNKNNTAYWQLQAIWGDSTVKCQTRSVAAAATQAHLPTWKLIFNSGIFIHSATAFYLLGGQYVFNSTLADVMKDYWLSFAVHLDPNTASSFANTSRPVWPQYQSNGNVLLINDSSIQTIVDPEISDRCKYFETNALLIRE